MPGHAAIVRHIFERYLAIGNVRMLSADLIAHGIVAPDRETSTGMKLGGRPFSRGQLYLLLRNPVYVGRIPHRETSYDGLHDAIIEQDVWDRTQALLAEHRQGQRNGRAHDQPSPLAGLVFDEAGQPLVTTHACKGTTQYRYYVSRDLHHARTTSGWRIPAGELETAVAQALSDALGDPLQLASRLDVPLWPDTMAAANQRCGDAAARLSKRGRQLFGGLVAHVNVGPHAITIGLCPDAVGVLLGATIAHDHPALTVTLRVRLTRSGRVLRLVQPGGRVAGEAPPDSPLVRLLAQARDWNARLRQSGADITSLANDLGKTKSYVSRVVRLAYLAPDVTAAMLQGRQRAGVGSDFLTLPEAVPASWAAQRRLFLSD